MFILHFRRTKMKNQMKRFVAMLLASLAILALAG